MKPTTPPAIGAVGQGGIATCLRISHENMAEG
jgi:hypothetical protein